MTKLLGLVWTITVLAFISTIIWAEMHHHDPMPHDATDHGTQDTALPKVAKKTISLKLTADEELQEAFLGGFLPKISSDGRKAFQIYAAPKPEINKNVPRIAIVIQRLGYREKEAQFAIDQLPKEVALSFSPYAIDLNKLGKKARKKGHEVLIEVPMEPLNSNLIDAGTLALTTELSNSANLTNLKTAMSQMNGYVGIISAFGSRFTSQRLLMEPIINEINKRGLMYIDQKTTNYTHGPDLAKKTDTPFAFKDVDIDQELNSEEIDIRLRELEERAMRTGVALGIGNSKILTMQKIKAWAATLSQKGIALVPVTSIASQQQITSE